jgi:hypothetical protein
LAASPAVDAVVTLVLGAAVLGMTVQLWGVGGDWLAYSSVLLYLPLFQLAAVLDLGVLRVLLQCFEFWFLLLNACGAYVCSLVAFNNATGAASGMDMAFSTVAVIATDAARLSTVSKLRNALAYATLMLMSFVTYCAGRTSLMGFDQSGDRVSLVVLLWVNRVFTLGVFFLKYAVHLVRRPHVFIIINKPLRPDDGAHRLGDTLSRHPYVMESEGFNEQEEDTHVRVQLTTKRVTLGGVDTGTGFGGEGAGHDDQLTPRG